MIRDTHLMHCKCEHTNLIHYKHKCTHLIHCKCERTNLISYKHMRAHLMYCERERTNLISYKHKCAHLMHCKCERTNLISYKHKRAHLMHCKCERTNLISYKHMCAHLMYCKCEHTNLISYKHKRVHLMHCECERTNLISYKHKRVHLMHCKCEHTNLISYKHKRVHLMHCKCECTNLIHYKHKSTRLQGWLENDLKCDRFTRSTNFNGNDQDYVANKAKLINLLKFYKRPLSLDLHSLTSTFPISIMSVRSTTTVHLTTSAHPTIIHIPTETQVDINSAGFGTLHALASLATGDQPSPTVSALSTMSTPSFDVSGTSLSSSTFTNSTCPLITTPGFRIVTDSKLREARSTSVESLGDMAILRHGQVSMEVSPCTGCPYSTRIPQCARQDCSVFPGRPPSDFPGRAWIEPTYTLSATSIDIALDRISLISRADHYPGIQWILIFDNAVWADLKPASVTKGTQISFDGSKIGFVNQVTQVRMVSDTIAHVEAIAFEERGSYLPFGSTSLPPIIIHVPLLLLDPTLLQEYAHIKEAFDAPPRSFFGSLHHVFPCFF